MNNEEENYFCNKIIKLHSSKMYVVYDVKFTTTFNYFSTIPLITYFNDSFNTNLRSIQWRLG